MLIRMYLSESSFFLWCCIWSWSLGNRFVDGDAKAPRMVQHDIHLPDELVIKMKQKRNLLHSDFEWTFVLGENISARPTQPPTTKCPTKPHYAKPPNHFTKLNPNPPTHHFRLSKPHLFLCLCKVALDFFPRSRPWADPSQRPLPLLEECLGKIHGKRGDPMANEPMEGSGWPIFSLLKKHEQRRETRETQKKPSWWFRPFFIFIQMI